MNYGNNYNNHKKLYTFTTQQIFHYVKNTKILKIINTWLWQHIEVSL